MSIQLVREYFRPLGREQDILEFQVSSATVELAAQAVGVIPARIAKTLSFLVEDGCVLIVTAGDAKIDNAKFKAFFHTKAKMLTPEQVTTLPVTPSAACAPSVIRRAYAPIWMCPCSALPPSSPRLEAATPPLS